MTAPLSAYYGIAEYDQVDYGVALPDFAGDATRISVVRGGAYTTRAAIWVADGTGRKIERLPVRVPVEGTIDFNEDRTVFRHLRLTVNDPERLRPHQDYIIPEITLADAGGEVARRDMGLFLVMPPATTLTKGLTT